MSPFLDRRQLETLQDWKWEQDDGEICGNVHTVVAKPDRSVTIRAVTTANSVDRQKSDLTVYIKLRKKSRLLH